MPNPIPPSVDPAVLLEDMTESVLVTTAEIDPPGPFIVYANPAFERMTGWSRQEIIGQTPRILQGPKTDRAIFEDLRRKLSQGQVWEGQAVNYRKDGSEFVMEWSIVPVRRPDGSIGQYLAVQRDVTLRVTLERELAAAREAERAWIAKLEQTNQHLNALNEEQLRTLDLFVKYVPEPVVRKALDPEAATTIRQGELVHVAVLFCDLRNFTGLTEKLDPTQTVYLLNTYYGMMADVIRQHAGVISQFVGDEIFVTFGAPLPMRQCEASAVRCAWAMVQHLPSINAVLEARIHRRIHVGIGINAGMVVAGNLGSDDRLSYSITGDTVNTAKRIESLTKSGLDLILISESVFAETSHLVETKSWDPTPVKGKGQTIQVYQLVGLRPAVSAPPVNRGNRG